MISNLVVVKGGDYALYESSITLTTGLGDVISDNPFYRTHHLCLVNVPVPDEGCTWFRFLDLCPIILELHP
jgi:hypothetical protein